MYTESKLKRTEILKMMQSAEYQKLYKDVNEKALKRFKEKPYQLKYMEEHGGR